MGREGLEYRYKKVKLQLLLFQVIPAEYSSNQEIFQE